jgi:undecaprenyl-diphosphatase
MDLALLLKSLVMGMVEGLTEFLPVSSLGHVIIVGDLLQFPIDIAATFEIFVQTGALIALILYFARDLVGLLRRAPVDRQAQRLPLAVAVAVLPAATVGVLLGDLIKQYLFSPVSVAFALLIGGILMLVAEQIVQGRKAPVTSLEGVDPKRALAVGVSQVLALYPGMSRSAPTIAGGLLVGLDRPMALRFSFYLAIPTLLAASGFDLVRSVGTITAAAIPPFVVGAVTSFLVALVVIHFFLGYVSNHTLRPFAWYRIVIGVLMFVLYLHIR